MWEIRSLPEQLLFWSCVNITSVNPVVCQRTAPGLTGVGLRPPCLGNLGLLVLSHIKVPSQCSHMLDTRQCTNNLELGTATPPGQITLDLMSHCSFVVLMTVGHSMCGFFLSWHRFFKNILLCYYLMSKYLLDNVFWSFGISLKIEIILWQGRHNP